MTVSASILPPATPDSDTTAIPLRFHSDTTMDATANPQRYYGDTTAMEDMHAYQSDTTAIPLRFNSDTTAIPRRCHWLTSPGLGQTNVQGTCALFSRETDATTHARLNFDFLHV